MHLQVFTDYPSWFWLLCLLCGIVYALGLYFREKKITSAIADMRGQIALGALRAAAVAVLAFLLLNPFLKSKFNETEKPVLVLAMDNSASILAQKGDSLKSAEMRAALIKDLKNEFDVRMYTFGESLKENTGELHFDEKNTDISSALAELNNLYTNLNVGGIVLISDGIYNTGSNPVYVKSDLGAPVYTVALGDTVPKKDIRIARTLHNNIVYLKDKFTIAADVEAEFCKGADTRIAVTEISKGEKKSIGEKNISVGEDNFSATYTWEITADAPGIQHYQVRVSKIEGESTTDNNIEDIYIEVLDARQKVLLLANSPHPDVNALEQAIESNQNYQVDVLLANEFKGSAAGYDLIILHQLPSLTYTISGLLNEINTRHIPVLFVLGSQTALPAFNSAQSLLKITAGGQSANEVTATTDPGFNLFVTEERSLGIYPKLPALSAPFGQYSVSPASQAALYQKIGSVNTKNPVLVFSLPGGEKTGILCAENFWKWRLYDYVLNSDHAASDELISKSIQYLAVKNDKKQFRVTQAKNVLNENEQILFDAELYNESYELINGPDATISITNEDGRDFPFQFSKSGKRYTLNAGFFPAGNYTFDARVSYNGKEFTDKGAFSISPVRLETLNATANHALLNQLAVQSGGKMVYPEQTSALEKMIKEHSAAKPVLHEIIKTQSVINLKWIFFVLLGLLAIEWFVRKFNGGY